MSHTSTNRVAIALSFVTLLASSSLAQWTNDPNANLAVCATTGDQAVPKIAATGDGKTWFGWFDQRNGTYAVYVQLVDANGNPQFASNGLLVSGNPQSSSLVDWDLISDAQGNAVLVFTDTRAGADLDVYAYRIAQNGTFLWGANGVTLSNNNDFEASPGCCATSDGNFVFVWTRSPNSGDGTVRVQKLDANGVPQYAADGFAIAATGESPGFADVVAGDNGSFIVSWLRNIKTFSSPRNIRAQKFDPAGTAQWNGGNPVSVFDSGSVPIGYWPVVQSDSAGGAVFTWHHPVGVSGFECLAQHVNAAGSEVFAHNGVLVSTEANVIQLDPALAYSPSTGDMIIAFNRENSNQSLWGVGAQKISSNGTLLWGAAGVSLEPINSTNKDFERAVPFGDGAMIFYFDAPTTPLPPQRVLARRLDANGNSLWGASAVVMCSNLSAKDDIEVVIDSSGVARAVWHDERNDIGDIYAQNIDVDGTLGNGSPCDATNYCVGAPNSVGPGATIGHTGSTSVAFNDLVLTASGCPHNKSGIFFYGPHQIAATPFDNGFLCFNGGFYRLHPTVTSATGTATSALDVNSPPTPAGQITAGSVWNFQFWYRDPTQGPSGSNLSNALQVTFCQ